MRWFAIPAEAGIQEPQAEAFGYSFWIPAPLQDRGQVPVGTWDRLRGNDVSSLLISKNIPLRALRISAHKFFARIMFSNITEK